jgi:hypothetical protein
MFNLIETPVYIVIVDPNDRHDWPWSPHPRLRLVWEEDDANPSDPRATPP